MHTRHACTVDPPVLLTSDVVGGSQQAEACNDELHGCRHGYKSLDFWNASFSGARRTIDDTMAPGKHTTHRLQKRIPKIPVYPLYGFCNSFCSLPSLSFSLSQFWARDANGCSSDFRLCVHSAPWAMLPQCHSNADSDVDSDVDADDNDDDDGSSDVANCVFLRQ